MEGKLISIRSRNRAEACFGQVSGLGLGHPSISYAWVTTSRGRMETLSPPWNEFLHMPDFAALHTRKMSAHGESVVCCMHPFTSLCLNCLPWPWTTSEGCLVHCSFQLTGPVVGCRKYCMNETDWAVPTVLLDEFDGAGWNLIRDLVTGSRSATELQQNAFCSS